MRRLPRTVEGDDDGETDGYFRSSDGDDEKDEHLRVEIRQAIGADVEAAEGDQREVRSIQHQLEAHENRDDVPPPRPGGSL